MSGFVRDRFAKIQLPLGRRLTVRLQTLDLRIGVRIPASQPEFPQNPRPHRKKAKLRRDAKSGRPQREAPSQNHNFLTEPLLLRTPRLRNLKVLADLA